jgi:hypothetical protein
VVFDLFQDLAGFSLDDYKPFSDVAPGLDRLVRFMQVAVAERGGRLVTIDATTCDLFSSSTQTRLARFTTDRDAATASDDLDLMGLDHPLVQEELGRWRALSPEDIGIAVSGDVSEAIVLSSWLVEAQADNGGRRVVVQPVAVKLDGTRSPQVERQVERFLQAPAAGPTLGTEERARLFTSAVEPTLQRELRHKGAADGAGSYAAELIGYIEIVPTTP